MSSSVFYYTEIFHKISSSLFEYVVPVFCVVGNIGNVLSALIFLKKSWRKNVCVFYLNVCLVFNCLYINSSMIAFIFIFGFNINVIAYNVVLCKIHFYLTSLLSTLLPNVLILASIDRLLISSQNVDTRLYSSKRLAYFSISISTFIWIIFNFHLLIKVNIQELGNSQFNCYYDLSNIYLAFASYSSLICICLLSLIMIILAMFAFKNVRHIRTIPRQQQRGQIRIMTKKDFQLLRCLFVQDIIYIIFSMGSSIYTVYQATTIGRSQTQLELTISQFVNNITNFLHDIPYCASFFIFVFVSKAFRNEVKRMIYKIVGKDPMIGREEENRQETVDRDNIQLNVVVVSNNVLPH